MRPSPIGSLHIEMPRFNERRHGRPYRYVWGVGAPLGVPTHVTGLVKVDLNDPNRHDDVGAGAREASEVAHLINSRTSTSRGPSVQ